MNYLGYIVTEEGICPDPEKITSILNYATPKCDKDVRRLLGMTGWYRRFIPNFASIAAPLTELLKKSKGRFVWTNEAELAFMEFKKLLTSEPILSNPDYGQPFIIQCDASDTGVGGVLMQGKGDDERIIAFMSQKLSSTQQKYHTTERECLAVVLSIEKFRPYIEGSNFTVITDHASLLWLQNLKDPTGRVGRWALRLQGYDLALEHRKGKFMQVPDALSRAVSTVDVISFNKSNDLWYNTIVKGVTEDLDKYPLFKIQNDVVYKHCDKNKTDVGNVHEWKIVVLKDKRTEVLYQSHDDLLSAHGGVFKTMYRVKREYYWPRMKTDILNYVRNCEICKANKPSNKIQQTPMGSQRIANRPWEMLYIDFVGPLPRSKQGNMHMLVVVESFTKFVHAHPLRVANAKGVIQFLENRIFLVFGFPKIIVSDNGSQFISTEFKECLQKYDVRHWLTARYHPQANAAEAANKTLETAVRAYIKDTNGHRDWDKNLLKICCALNTAVHTSSGYAPYFANFGQHMILNGRTYDHNMTDDYDRIENSDISKLRSFIANNLRENYEVSKRRYDLRTRPITYQEGEEIWKKNFIQSDAVKNISSKLCPKYIKCKVKTKVGTNTYELMDMNGKSLGVFNSKVMKR